LLLVWAAFAASGSGAGTERANAGLVYGAGHAFSVAPPAAWVLDNQRETRRRRIHPISTSSSGSRTPVSRCTSSSRLKPTLPSAFEGASRQPSTLLRHVPGTGSTSRCISSR